MTHGDPQKFKSMTNGDPQRFTTKPRKTTTSTTKDSKTTPQNPKSNQISTTTRDFREEIKLNLNHNPPN